MNPFFLHPFLILFSSLCVFWIAARIGAICRERRGELKDAHRSDLALILGATLTLLGLIIGFTFSMALTRYDLRKTYEEAEANAIGTEYVRLDLLPTNDAEHARVLLRRYLGLRIAYYGARDLKTLERINVETTQLQSELWQAVRRPIAADPTPVGALVLSGMNDVLNSQGYTQAAWWNRIPIGAWALLFLISLFSNLLVGYAAHGRSFLFLMILPLVLSISLFLIADIDSPRHGIIRVQPENLESLLTSLGPG